jgi:hypothetical protein
MGTGALQFNQPPLFPGLSGSIDGNAYNLLAELRGGTPSEIVAESSQNPPSADGVGEDASQAIARQFDALVYRSQVERFSLTVSLQEAAARVNGEGREGGAEAQAAQLSFSFFAESRTEELVRFSERTQSVADGLQGTQRESYLEASRKMAQRFSLSLSITGAALNGFAGASEKLGGADSQSGIDRLLGLTKEALSDSDDALNKIFELLDAFFSNMDTDFQTRFDELLAGLQSIGLLKAPASTGATTGGQQIQLSQTSFSLQLEFSFESVEIVSIGQGEVQQSDPITFDLDGDGIELTSYGTGARFDILGKGSPVNTAFVTGGDAFLAIDRNGNGSIDSGKELFGDQNGARNGFEELRKFDSNSDSVIDARDKDFSALHLFRDNGNGVTEGGELISLAEAGIESIDLNYQNVDEKTSGGNRIAQSARFRYGDGRYGRAVDAILNYTV